MLPLRGLLRDSQEALASLVENGKIVAYKRGYRVFGGTQSAGSGVIVVIAWTDDEVGLQSYMPSALSFWYATEQACLRHGVNLVVVDGRSVLLDIDKGRSARDALSVRGKSVLGYLVMTFGFDSTELQRLVPVLAGEDTPIALLEEKGGTSVLPKLPIRVACQVGRAHV